MAYLEFAVAMGRNEPASPVGRYLLNRLRFLTSLSSGEVRIEVKP
jgi:hypothetical protein